LTRIDDPVPRSDDGACVAYRWPVEHRESFKTLQSPPEKSFLEVFEGRRSTRQLGYASLDTILSALHFALSARFRKEGDALNRSQRPSLSAGALHPISVMLFTDSRVLRLDTDAFALEQLVFPEDARDAWVSMCRRVLPDANGTFLVLVADMARPEAAYVNSESLVWRDAGAMLQTLALTAELFGLGFCPLGILGNDVVSVLPSSGQLLAVGSAVVGVPAQSVGSSS